MQNSRSPVSIVAVSKGVNVNLPDVSPKLRTQKGDEYVPDSLHTMLGALHCRYIKVKGTATAFSVQMSFQGPGKSLMAKL